MGFKNQTYFNAKINGVDVYSIRSKINYKIDNLDGRMECIDNALKYGDEFYNEYFSEHCKTNITSDDMLLSETNVVQSLEAMANYILAKDPEYNKTEEEYFVNERRMIDKGLKENEFDNMGMSIIEDNQMSNDIPKNESNFKKLKKQKITADDLNRTDELGGILRDYNCFLQLISNYTKKNNNDGVRVKHPIGKKATSHVYANHQSAVKDDMINIKDSLMKVHGYNLKNFSESTKPDYSVIDLTNVDHLLGGWVEYESSRYKVKSNGLLSFKATDDYQDDFNCIIIDVENLVSQCELSEFHLDLLELYQCGLNHAEIAKELNSYKVKIERELKNIAKKVSERALHSRSN